LIEVFSRSTGYLIMGALSIASTILIKTSIKRSKKEASKEEFPLEEMLINRK